MQSSDLRYVHAVDLRTCHQQDTNSRKHWRCDSGFGLEHLHGLSMFLKMWMSGLRISSAFSPFLHQTAREKHSVLKLLHSHVDVRMKDRQRVSCKLPNYRCFLEQRYNAKQITVFSQRNDESTGGAGSSVNGRPWTSLGTWELH